ncbi:MAG: hypothetical protein COS24_00100 [Candidatus Nealsonbacteria bacterium CG02_land_8_20_14_3_00_34_20]|uniref:Prepilin-type N-terminal cleavage/methylation domain-containing protein n=2 Tax=Candidatus Nealsoniibacteriota TaxID=1817911 RepID=A0A2M7DBJ4_9BACT|nr:MAG: hypothetical protein COS24_00100 [Candidatus Nealsonbacteria bacterium CG02_land_8_20_14_3_00_34_20]PIW92528.1 MAG: hypothetical protein COZ88_01775 [Candidatus Nealsonbacteria bacterium CG_4_8_14_3_um_filter_34_13]
MQFKVKNMPRTVLRKTGLVWGQTGFTLLEMIFSIAIITIGVLGIHNGLTYAIEHTKQAREYFTASYLAKEGIEIVKNIRDTNWVEGAASWKDGLTSCASGCEADYDDSLSSYTGKYFYIHSTNYFYQYTTSSEKTPYQRKITITEVDSDELDIKIEVFFKGNTMTAKENIYNWR